MAKTNSRTVALRHLVTSSYIILLFISGSGRLDPGRYLQPELNKRRRVVRNQSYVDKRSPLVPSTRRVSRERTSGSITVSSFLADFKFGGQ